MAEILVSSGKKKTTQHSGPNLMKDCYPESTDIIICLWEVWAASTVVEPLKLNICLRFNIAECISD